MNNYHDTIEPPFLIEPMALAHDLTLFCSIRFVSQTYPPDEPLNISPKADAILDRGVEGTLIFDIWKDVQGEMNCATAVFTLGREVLTLDYHKVCTEWAGAGLLFLMTAMALNLLGWSRYLAGVNDLGGW